ncbi:LIC_11904 family protein [Leptospira adleri]|uniref:Uncharacterized protein n=1 Tax=Leptospira adleri TaxID=2023186 RepID=A0A2M9YJB1_9LEPT|nr:hypothetical protein [Leptospira adleri]PJZ51629.1 hypothetical protein CH380_19485 [Leptospira adleri]PJZ61862.1 hypothetical protein CH376_10680 [Leptospira adleri]
MSKIGSICVSLGLLTHLSCSKVSNPSNLLWLSAIGLNPNFANVINGSGSGPDFNITSSPETRFQINPEVVENLGFLFNNDPHFPELRKIQDFSIVSLDPLIRDPLSRPTDVNLFILDSTKGNIIYSKNPGKISYFQDSSLTNYSSILVLPSGKILLVSKTGFLNTCFQYTAVGSVVKTPSCNDSTIQVSKLFNFKTEKGEILFRAPSGSLKIFSVENQSISEISINPTPIGIIDVSYSSNQKSLVVSENVGKRISVYKENQNGSFILENKIESFSFTNTLGKSYKAPYISSVAVNKDGVIYALSNVEDAVYTIDPYLKIVNVFEDTLQFRPFRKMMEPLRIRISSGNEDLYVQTKNEISVLRDVEVNKSSDFQWSLPINQDSLKQAVIESLKQSNYNLNKSIFDQPAVKAVLDSYRNLAQ